MENIAAIQKINLLFNSTRTIRNNKDIWMINSSVEITAITIHTSHNNTSLI